MYLATGSVAYDEKTDLLFDKYFSKLDTLNIESSSSIDEVKEKLQTIIKEDNSLDTLFIVKPNEVVYKDTDLEISDFFIKYIFNVDNPNHTYEYFTGEYQGVYEIFTVGTEKYAAGIMYRVNQLDNYWLIVVTFTITIMIIIWFLIFFANEFAKPIKQISDVPISINTQ